MARDVQEAGVRLDRAELRQRERGHRPKVDRDWEAVKRLLTEQDELVEAASRLRTKYGDSEEVASVEDLARRRISDAEPIRISHAQKLLEVSNQTVRAWTDHRVLDDCGGSPQRVGLESVMRAKQIADELREQGRDREFMSVVLSRLEALALQRDKDFRKSVGQLRRGKRLPRPY